MAAAGLIAALSKVSNKMHRWEYQTLVLSAGPSSNETKINEMGRLGWELVSVTTPMPEDFSIAYFKRTLQKQPSAPPIAEVHRLQSLITDILDTPEMVLTIGSNKLDQEYASGYNQCLSEIKKALDARRYEDAEK